MKICQRIVLTIAVVTLLIASMVDVTAKNDRSSALRATKVRIEMRDIYGSLFVTIGNTEKKITDQFYKEDDWGEPDAGKVRPYKTERHNLNSLLLRRVIVNKKDAQ